MKLSYEEPEIRVIGPLAGQTSESFKGPGVGDLQMFGVDDGQCFSGTDPDTGEFLSNCESSVSVS